MLLLPLQSAAVHVLCLQACLEAVLELFDKLKDSDKQRAVINADDEHYAAVAAATAVPSITYSINNRSADVHAETIEFTLWDTTVGAAAF